MENEIQIPEEDQYQQFSMNEFLSLLETDIKKLKS